ncbi:hypothetical protein CR956_01325, partial [Candidatus Saccharibacteria bacterium]
MGFEISNFDYDPSYDPEKMRGVELTPDAAEELRSRESSRESSERERTITHQELTQLRETLAEDSDGIIHLSIPAYEYNFSINPFVGVGPRVRRIQEVSRHLDVVFLHRFMYQDVIVAGICSRDYVEDS